MISLNYKTSKDMVSLLSFGYILSVQIIFNILFVKIWQSFYNLNVYNLRIDRRICFIKSLQKISKNSWWRAKNYQKLDCEDFCSKEWS